MNRFVLTAFAALFLGSFAATAVFSQPDVAPARIAFVDLKKALDGYRKRREIQDLLDAKKTGYETAFRKQGAKLTELGEKLNTLNRGSDEFTNLERQVGQERWML